MNKTPCLSVLLLGLALAGCSTPVPQGLTPADVPETFASPAPTPSQAWPDAAWWQAFGDDSLSALVTGAQADNRDLAAAAARVMQAQAQTTIQRAALFPQVGAQGGYGAGGCRGASCQRFLSGKTASLDFGASYELDFWGLAQDNLRAAQEQLKSARFARQSVALSVTANVARQYFSVLAIRRRIAIAHDNIAAIDGILNVITLRVKAGATSHLDMAREQAQVEAVQAQLPSLETAEKRALFTLAVLTGRLPEGFAVSTRDLDTVTAPIVGAGLPSELLHRRPDIAQAEANLATAHANLDAARAAFLPQISLTGSGGFASAAIGTLLQGSSFGYGYGVGLLQTIFDGGRLAGQKDLAEGVQKELIADYQTAALNAYADVENALVEVANSMRTQDHLKREVTAAQEAFSIAQLQYRQGAADLLTVLQAQQTLFSAQDQLVQAALSNRLAAVHLYEALGGGWSEPEDERTQRVAADRKD